MVTKQLTVAIDFHRFLLFFFLHTMEVNGYRQLFGYHHSLKYFILCSSAEKISYNLGTTWGWVNYDIYPLLIDGWWCYIQI